MAWSRTVAARATEDKAPTVSSSRSGRLDEMEARLTSTQRITHRSRLANIGTRCFDDGPMDYTGPEEFDDDDGAGSYREEAHRVDTPTAPNDGELNANLAVSRRAGDKSDW